MLGLHLMQLKGEGQTIIHQHLEAPPSVSSTRTRGGRRVELTIGDVRLRWDMDNDIWREFGRSLRDTFK